MKLARNRSGISARRVWSTRPNGIKWNSLRFAIPPVLRESPSVAGVRSNILARLEAYLFQSAEPLNPSKLAETLQCSPAEVLERIEELRELYRLDDSGFSLDAIAGGFLLRTGTETTPWLVRLKQIPAHHALPANLLETLVVIARKQPITRAEVEAIRGVASVEAIKVLLARGLVRSAGRHASLGRPQLFATTKRFLQHFGLNSLAELPSEL